MITIADKTNKDILRPAQRVGELFAVGVVLLLFGFFIYHQAADTGFFTEEFGAVEMFLLYGPLILSILPPFIRAFYGQRNLARPVEVVSNLFVAVAAMWYLFIVFPFEFAHLPDPLPDGLQPIISWIDNDIGKIMLALQLVAGPLTAIWNAGKYLVVRHQELA